MMISGGHETGDSTCVGDSMNSEADMLKRNHWWLDAIEDDAEEETLKSMRRTSESLNSQSHQIETSGRQRETWKLS